MEYSDIIKLSYAFFYENRKTGVSFLELFHHLNDEYSCGLENEFDDVFQTIVNESSTTEMPIYNSSLFGIYNDLTNKDRFPSNSIQTRYEAVFGAYIDNPENTDRILGLCIKYNRMSERKNTLVKVIKLDLDVLNSINDKDIYINSLNHFYQNWKEGVSFIEYNHYIINDLFLNLDLFMIEKLYLQITKNDSVIDPNMKQIASLDSMLGLLEYDELQHSLQESKEAKQAAKVANIFAVIGIFLSVIGLGLSIYYSKKQIEQSEKQFNIEQGQYLEGKKSVKDTLPIKIIHSPIIRPK